MSVLSIHNSGSRIALLLKRVLTTRVFVVALFAIFITTLSACSDGVELASTTDSADGQTSTPQTPGTTPTTTNTDTSTAIARDLSPHNDGFEGDFYSGVGQCSNCHDGLVDNSGNDISIGTDWSTSMMANSARDPYWIAKVAAEMERNPHLEDTLDETCSRCHTPMANDTAQKNNEPLSILDEGGVLDDQNPLFDHAMEGVSCTLCHQVEDDGLLGTVEGTSGNYVVAIQERRSDRAAYGPYTDPTAVRMQSEAEFKAVYGPHMASSASCGACHDLRTPEIPAADGSGLSPASGFPEQMVYTEWNNSSFAATDGSGRNCQSCHMPEVDGAVELSSQGGGIARENFSRHTFLGPNTVMQSLLMNNAESLGVLVPAADFSEAIERNREFVATGAAVQIVSSELQSTGESDGQLVTQVRIDNLAGHKLPSGFASRRAFVHFLVTDSAGNTVFESGAENADGSITGIDADTDSNQYEAHYELIDSSEQVQVYEAIMGDQNDAVTHTLMNATQYLKDNRLLPSGLIKASAPDDIGTFGNAIADADFDAGGDNIEYRVQVPAGTSVTVQVSLVYQPLAYGHLQDLFASDSLPDVAYFKTLYDAADLKSEVVATASVEVPAIQ